MKKIIFLLATFLATNFLSLSASADMGRVSAPEFIIFKQTLFTGK